VQYSKNKKENNPLRPSVYDVLVRQNYVVVN